MVAFYKPIDRSIVAVNQSLECSLRGDCDGAIHNITTAIGLYPYNDQLYDHLMRLLAMYYAQSGIRYALQDDCWDNAINDLVIALKLDAALFDRIHNDLALAYHARSRIYLNRCLSAVRNRDKDAEAHYAQLAYADSSAAVNLSPDDEYAAVMEDEQKVSELLALMYSGTIDMSAHEEAAVQRVMCELAKSPAAAMPRTSTLSADAACLEEIMQQFILPR